MKHCNPSSCCYWPWRDEFLGFFLWRWLGGQRTLSEANMRLQKHNPTMHRSTAQSQVSHFHSLLQVHFHHSHPVSSHLPSIFKPFHIFHFPATPPPPQMQIGRNWGSTWCMHTVSAHASETAMKTGRWGEAEGWARAVDVPVSNTFPQVEVCSPGGCVSAGKLCNEQKAGSLPDKIPTQPHIYLAFQKCSAYQWVLLTCQSRQRSASSAL